MASNTAQTVFTGNASQLEAEYKKIDAARERDIAKLKKQLEESKRAANEEIRLKHDIARAIEAARTPAEKYNQAIAKYDQALKQGKITLEQFNRLQQVEMDQLIQSRKATEKLTEAKTKQANATESSGLAMGSWSGSLSGALAAATALVTGINALAEAQRKLRRENEEPVFTIDAASRAYAAQTGLTTDAQRLEARDRILKIGRENAVLPKDAFAASLQLAGSGINDPGALDVFLKMRAASNEQFSGSDSGQLVEGMAMFMEGMGMEKNAKNFETVAQSAFGLFANADSSQTQVRDLADFAKAAPSLAGSHITPAQALALLGNARQTLDAPIATTGVSNMVAKLSTAQSTRSGEEALQMIGLKPSQVDFVGEDLYQVLGTLKKSLDQAPEEIRNNAIAKLFGEEATNKAAVTQTLNNIEKIKSIETTMINREAFDAAVQMNTTGVAAEMRRAEADKAIVATQFEGLIGGGAIQDRTVENLRTQRKLGRDTAAGATATFIEELPLIGTDAMTDNLAELNLIDQSERTKQAGRGFSANFLRSFGSLRAEEAAGNAGNAPDPLMAEQNDILRGLGDKLDKLAQPPGVRPNPATVGRPD